MAAAAAAAVSAKAVGADAIFRIYMACPNDPKVLLLDVSTGWRRALRRPA